MRLIKCVCVLAIGFLLPFSLAGGQEKQAETGDAKSFYAKCVEMVKIKDADKAIAYGEKAVALDGAHSEYYFQLGLAYAQKINQVGMMKKMTYAHKMVKAWEKAVELDGKNIRARQALAGYYLNAPSLAGGSVAKARAQAREIMKDDALMGYSIQALVEVKEKKWKEAQETGAKAFKLHMAFKEKNPGLESPLGEGVLNQIGYALLNAKKFEAAIEIFAMNIRAYPQSFNPYDSLAEAFLKSGDRKQAVENYEKALALNPNKTEFEKKAYVNQQEYLKKLKQQ